MAINPALIQQLTTMRPGQDVMKGLVDQSNRNELLRQQKVKEAQAQQELDRKQLMDRVNVATNSIDTLAEIGNVEGVKQALGTIGEGLGITLDVDTVMEDYGQFKRDKAAFLNLVKAGENDQTLAPTIVSTAKFLESKYGGGALGVPQETVEDTFGGFAPEEVSTKTERVIREDPESTTGYSSFLLDDVTGEVINKLTEIPAPRAATEVNIHTQKPASAGERTAIAETRASIDSMDNLKALFDASYVGPVEGRKGKVFNFFGMNPDQQAAFIAATFEVQNSMIRAITGAQMSEPEAKRIMQQIPTTTDADNVWIQKHEQTRKNFERTNKRRLEVLRQSEIRVPEDAPVLKPIGKMTREEKLAEIERRERGEK